MKTKRNFSGIYLRAKNEETGKFDNVVFEDLSEQQQDEMMNGRSEEWLKSLAKQLANTLNNIGEQFDIATEQLNIVGVSGSCSFNATEVKQMYDHLVALYFRSQMNGLVDIDTYDRQQLKKLLKLPDNYRIKMENNKDNGYVYVPYVMKAVKTTINNETVWYANKMKNLLLKIKRFFYKSKNMKNAEKYLNKPVNSSFYTTIKINGDENK